jgi:hypothetical protein
MAQRFTVRTAEADDEAGYLEAGVAKFLDGLPTLAPGEGFGYQAVDQN